MKHSESIQAISGSLVAFHSAIRAIAKDSVNPAYKSKFASLESITETVRPVLAKNGLALVQGGGVPISDETGAVTAVSVETMLVHESGEWISNGVTMPLDKATAQGVGSAVTYGRRYGLSALLALTTDEDDDGAKASERPARQPNSSGSVMKIGKSKGKPLSEVDERDLESAVAWARKTDAKKFDGPIGEMESEIARRQMELGTTPANLDRLLQEDARDLPFD